jgi:hypothetical protein
MKNTQVAAATKTAKPTQPKTGLKKRRGPLPRESATRHTSQKPPLEREVVDLLARRFVRRPPVVVLDPRRQWTIIEPAPGLGQGPERHRKRPSR